MKAERADNHSWEILFWKIWVQSQEGQADQGHLKVHPGHPSLSLFAHPPLVGATPQSPSYLKVIIMAWNSTLKMTVSLAIVIPFNHTYRLLHNAAGF